MEERYLLNKVDAHISWDGIFFHPTRKKKKGTDLNDELLKMFRNWMGIQHGWAYSKKLETFKS